MVVALKCCEDVEAFMVQLIKLHPEKTVQFCTFLEEHYYWAELDAITQILACTKR